MDNGTVSNQGLVEGALQRQAAEIERPCAELAKATVEEDASIPTLGRWSQKGPSVVTKAE